MTRSRSGFGRLKIYFGYAAGVGKTHTMLEVAVRARQAGQDVVAGYIEPHGREEIDQLAQHLEQLPFRKTSYQGLTMQEFDLQAALERKPEILLVDELPHSNAPDARHPKRYQDIAELQRAGIDVWTTMNVQHLEGLNDLVERLTGIVVQELVPDSVFDQADDVELIDLPPEELLERFHQGKVYAPEKAQRAMGQFFRRTNLFALRELALRRTAERVGRQGYRETGSERLRQHISSGERILVCIAPRKTTERVLRTAQRMASAFQAPWTALYVQTPDLSSEDPEIQHKVNEHLAHAGRLGADTVTISAENAVDGIVAHARQHGFTQIIVGCHEAFLRRRRFGRSITRRLLSQGGSFDVHVVSAGKDDRPPRTITQRSETHPVLPHHWLEAGSALALATGIAFGFREMGLAEANIIMAYLAAVVFAAVRAPLKVALISSGLAVLLYDLFFTAPFYTVVVDDIQYLFTFGVMGLVALTITTLTARVRRHARIAEDLQQRAERLSKLARTLSRQSGQTRLVQVAEAELREIFPIHVRMLLPDRQGRINPGPVNLPPIRDLTKDELALAEWVLNNGVPAGRGTDTLPGNPGLLLPLGGSGRTLGVVILHRTNNSQDPLWPAEEWRLLKACLLQVSIALEREYLSEISRNTEVQVETERLRSAILSSVSHDLRTPLSTILGAASSLQSMPADCPTGVWQDLLHRIVNEAVEMEKLIEDLVSMSRLEAQGERMVQLSWQEIDDVVNATLNRMRSHLANRPIHCILDESLPTTAMDPVLIQQVLSNLLENAITYSADRSPVGISVTEESGVIIFSISDRGPGIPEEDRERVFTKFYRGPNASDSRGLGIGLNICKAIVEAHRGRLWIEDNPGGGAVFRFSLPVSGWPPLPRPSTNATEAAEANA
ncbi:hypothetical protein CKO35_02355 [Ectothiorhodospira shaposhnikovii]|uniref:sensor histidine kinase n=1 Tax=Ectothiorhodospira shaposhnikovii TaxID=1054 RepID=UPI0019081FEB|nr:sensor histidine kinase KdpD [Ectothiorhodospira shaposhnikovii]MBK1672159.1 hypothetical protein [Ectothiorhodospira shaposhnikovii]